MSENKGMVDFSDEICKLREIKGSLTILKAAGEVAVDDEELFAYQLLTDDAFKRHIDEMAEIIKKLQRHSKSGVTP